MLYVCSLSKIVLHIVCMSFIHKVNRKYMQDMLHTLVMEVIGLGVLCSFLKPHYLDTIFLDTFR